MMPTPLLLLEETARRDRNARFHTSLNQLDDGQYTLHIVDSKAEAYRYLAGSDAALLIIEACDTEYDTRCLIEELRSTLDGMPLLVLVDDETSEVNAIEFGADDALVRDDLESALLRRTLAHLLARGRRSPVAKTGNPIFHNIATYSADGMVLVNEQGMIQVWNPMMESITGISSAQAAGHPVWDVQFGLIPPEAQNATLYEMIQTQSRMFLAHGFQMTHGKYDEGYIQRPDGTRRYLQTSMFAIPGQQGYWMAAIHRDITAQKDEADRLSVLSTAVEQNPTAILVADTAWQIEYVNPEFTRLTGFTLDDVRGKTPEMFRSGQTEPGVYREIASTTDAGGTWRGEFLNRKKNGEIYLEETLIYPVRNTHGKIVRFLAMKENVTDRRSQQAQLRYQAALVESISDAVISSSEYDRKIVSWNQAAERLYGWRAEEVTGKSLLSVLRPVAIDVEGPYVRQQVEQNGQWQGDIIATARDGRQVYVLASITRLLDAAGNTAGTVEIHRDIQDRIRAEAVLRESERFASSIVDSLSEHIVILDEQGTIIAVNEAWRAFAQDNGADMGRVCEGANYLSVLDVEGIGPEVTEASQFKTGLLAVIRGEEKEFAMEYSCHSPTEKRWFIGRVTRFRDDGPMRVVVAHTSITRRIQVEEQLHQANNFLLMLNRIITMTIASLDAQEVLDIACQELAAVFSAPQVAAALMDEKRTEYKVVAEYRIPGRPTALGRLIPTRDNPSLDYMRKYKIPLVAASVELDPFLSPVQELLTERGTVSMLLIPLFVNDELYGSIGVDFTRTHNFTDEEIILAASVAQAISKPLENSILHERLTQHTSHLESIVESRTEQLIRLNRRMGAILNNASDAIILADMDNTIENANEAFERQFGFAPDGAYGRPIFHIAEPGFREMMMQAVQVARETGIDQRVQLRALRQDGTGFDADVAIARVENNESHVVCSIRDITRLKEVERIKDRFISMVSHELRTPTTSLVLSSNTLKTHYARMTEEQREKVVDRMQRQSQVLAELIEGILDLSRIEVRTDVQKTSPVEMQKILKLLINEFQPALTNRGQKLEAMIEEQTPVLYGEEMDIERVWRNLMANAVKYTPEGGNITVRFGQIQVRDGAMVTPVSTLLVDLLPWQEWSGVYLVGQVEDTGHGIPPQDLQQLFTRFYRGWAAASNTPGTGLGLSLVKEVLRLYSGDIQVTSQLNVGSTFSFWIPISQE